MHQVMAETTVNMYHNNTTVQQQHQEDAAAAHLAIVNDVAYRYLMPIFITAGILTNLLNVVMLGRMRHHQQQRQAQATTFCYLMWLALTDMLASIALVPALVHVDRTHLSYGWAFYYAHLELPTLNSLTSASVYIVVGLSVDRYIAVCHPRRYQDVSAPRLAVIRITLSLLVPALIYIPHSFYLEVVSGEGGVGWTYEGVEMATPGAWHAWEVVVELCHRMAPAILLVLLNCSIIYTFKKVTARRKNIVTKNDSVNNSSSNASKKSEEGGKSQQERRLIYLLVTIVATFLLTNLPATVLALIDTAGATHGSFSLEVYRAVANCLEVLSFSLNFVLYFIFVPGVRQGLQEAVKAVRVTLCGLVVNTVPSQSCFISENNTKNTDSTEV
ncbi:G-protein coupled receptor AH9.1-like [Homarus americanus]|uniref:G-protein coupled receptor AH9.1-like n=1 Tax=Homarus americanus TaxID=6706 RepID=A0A8J5NB13_HOMAM|nr:G-protein coupled receptor AH9.1-like [Homarus americanus]